MDIAERVKEIIIQPRAAWEKIKGENTSVKALYTSYAAVLAVIPAAAYFVGMSLVGISLVGGTYRVPVTSGVVYAALHYLFTLAGMYVVALIIDALAPRFHSRKDQCAASKVAVYSWTPALVAGVLAAFPVLSPLILLASLYSLYLLYLGLPVLMETPREKTVAYFAFVIAVSIVVWIAASALAALAVRLPAAGMMP
jgi:hypothetical protein